tara:strand:- start:68777 stop:69874 length:1098 start_codon:yes stop_codon:yes gene_type:complete
MAKKYFHEQLNYTLGNEDTSMDVEIVKKLGSNNIFTIAGCGSRAFPLLASNPEKMTILDFSKPQILLCKLREATYRTFEYEDFLIFWGYPPFARFDYHYQRKILFSNLDLDSETKDFFQKIFSETNFDSLLYLGSWERTFQTLAKLVRKILGRNFDDIFGFHNLEDQVSYYYNDFPIRKWKMIIFLLGNKSVFNALLYKGDFIVKNFPETHFQYYFESFERLFTGQLARSSFFAHLCFYGEINHPDGVTIEAHEENFTQVKDYFAGGGSVNYAQGDFVTHLKASPEKFDFLSLSDVPSYFQGEVEKNFMEDISKSVQESGVVCLRNYLRRPECETNSYDEVTAKYSDHFRTEAVQMYRPQLFKKK